ncbi:MAG: bifunctional folylpolyglutamate synthase/dihydrofolate synthase [Candidatus Gastranaerophilales bacterium]|nr:bifunctional folylpolyglutamate synthase/dihydrofolate synthase [Candidatus Gastranaerophilales bacterium]
MKDNYLKTEKLLHSAEKFHIKLGLERISAILELLDNPQEKIRVVHIAGTNGKGSVSALTAEILKSSGYKTALYTSPHLFKYNERFKINGVDISDDDFSAYTTEINQLAENNGIDVTEFELLTAAAYKYFYDNKVDFAVMETGLGGRFDAVNVVKQPVVTAITSISIDHKDRLGDTVEKIAFEKAGIIKDNTPLVINKNNNGYEVIFKVAEERKAPVFDAEEEVKILFENGINYAVFAGQKYEFNLWGLHQKQNLDLVLKITEVLKQKGFKINDNSICQALKNVFLPARFQYNKKYNLIIDGAHNYDAALNLLKNLDYYFPNQKRTWIYGAISTKEYDKITNMLFESGDTVILPDFEYPLAVPYAKIIEKIKKSDIKFKNLRKTENILNFLSQTSLNIMTGSFYMAGNLLPEEVIR